MWKILLPDQIEVRLYPVYHADTGQMDWYYKLDGMPLLEWIGKQVVRLMGNLTLDQIEVTTEKLITPLPRIEIPFKITDIRTGEIIITLARE